MSLKVTEKLIDRRPLDATNAFAEPSTNEADAKQGMNTCTPPTRSRPSCHLVANYLRRPAFAPTHELPGRKCAARSQKMRLQHFLS
ncbi:conserved hypothetical protein [Ricinus communis]|uniref:Uncharacterized protein n=1 Tax=Ricinus communis TaxID=3988 RepID=B9S3K4_RICCO|nr:conserved hypothetical protein [Ricinus communis]